MTVRTAETGAPMRIAWVGGAEGGTVWKLSEQDAIEAIDEDRLGFYVIIGGTLREVVVGGGGSVRYLKTDVDHRAPNDLLALASCPEDAGAGN